MSRDGAGVLNPYFSLQRSEEAAAFRASLDDWVNGVGEGVVIDEDQRQKRAIAKHRIIEAYDTRSATLSLSGIDISSLPSQINQLTELRSLDVSDNGLSSLPNEISDLSQLIDLRLDDNWFASIPPAVFDMVSLRILGISNNLMTSISPEIARLRNLKHLDFCFNEVSEIPPEFERLVNLRTIIANSNELTTLPDFLFTSLNLSRIEVRDNDFSEDEEQILRVTFQENNITSDYFVENYRAYASDESLSFNDALDQILAFEPNDDVKSELKIWLETGLRSKDKDDVGMSASNLDNFRKLIEQCSRTASWQGLPGAAAEFVLETKSAMCKILLHVAKAAYDDERVANIVEEASVRSDVTCGDRVTMTLLDVQMAALHFKTSPRFIDNPEELFRYARQKAVYNFLTKKAECHIDGIVASYKDSAEYSGLSEENIRERLIEENKLDEVEIYLAHMRLLPRLGVEVGGLDMLYGATVEISNAQLSAFENEYRNGEVAAASGDEVLELDTSLMRDLKMAGKRIDAKIAKIPHPQYLSYLTMLNSADLSVTNLVESVELLTPEMVSEKREFDCFCGKVISSDGELIDESDGEFLNRVNKIKKESLKLKILVLHEVHKVLVNRGREFVEQNEKEREVIEREVKGASDDEGCAASAAAPVNILDRAMVDDLVRRKVQELAEYFAFKVPVEKEGAASIPRVSPEINKVDRDDKGRPLKLKRARSGSFGVDFD